jgi:signal transduction histidine kinase
MRRLLRASVCLSALLLPVSAPAESRPRPDLLLDQTAPAFLSGELIVAVVATILAQAVIITWLLVERRRRHRAELQSRQYLMEITQMDRAVTLGALSSSFAHELNQPLGAIMSNAETAAMLLDQTPPRIGRVKEILADICRDDLRASEIIARLRMLMKKSELRTQEVDLNGVVSAVLRIIEPEARQLDIILADDTTPGRLVVRADPVHLQQVVLNLAVNAIDAMRTSKKPRVLLLRSIADERDVMLSVSDTGPGIPAADLDAIFGARFSHKPDGTGLGLFIADMIVRTYGGRIWAENKLDGGAMFKVVVPLQATAAQGDSDIPMIAKDIPTLNPAAVGQVA